MIIKNETFLTISYGTLLFFYTLSEFWLKIGSVGLPYYFIIGLIFVSIFALTYKRTIFNILQRLTKLKFGKALLLFIVWCAITIIISLFKGTFIPGSFFTNYIGNFYNSFLFPMLLSCIIIVLLPKYKNVKKILIFIFLLLFIFGFIDWLSINNIGIFKNIMSIFVNKNSLLSGAERFLRMDYGAARIASLCREPGEYGGLLTVSVPIFWYFFTTKEKIFKNNVTNIIIKKSLFIFFLISLYLTQSPINIIFLGIILIVNFWNYINRYQKIIISVFLLLISGFIYIYTNFDNNNNMYSGQNVIIRRIATVQKNLFSINSIVEEEASFATRLCSFEAQLRIAIDNPVFGVGYGNINSKWGNYVLNLPHLITPEIERNALMDKQAGSGSFLWKIVSETGFVGLFLLYYFLFYLYKYGLKVSKNSNESEFIIALAKSLIIYISFSWYLYLPPIFMFYFGMLMGFVYKNIFCKRVIIIPNDANYPNENKQN